MTDVIKIPIIFVTEDKESKPKKTTNKKNDNLKEIKEEKEKSPIPSHKSEDRGGVFGESEGKIIDSKKAKGIRGGTSERDSRSNAPFSHKTFLDDIKQIKKKQKQQENNQKALEKLISKHQKAFIQGSEILSNPGDFVGKNVLQMLGKAGPYGAAAAAAIGAIITAPENIEKIIKALAVKGAPLNRDFRVIVEEVITGFLSLDSQQRRDLGLDSFIVAQTTGFKPVDGTDVYNSLLDRDEIRINRVNQDEK